MNEEIRKEEYFEKCLAILKVLDENRLEENERVMLLWCMRDYMDLLGVAIGIMPSK